MTALAFAALAERGEGAPMPATDIVLTWQPRPPVALYVHVPFCLSVCPYCDFVVYAGSAARGPRNQVDAFLDALHVEVDLRADAAEDAFGAVSAPLESVYIGGGTPSLLSAASVAELLRHVERRFGIESDAEITLEANPGTSDLGDLVGFRAAGITRLSLGAQSLDPAELRALGRRHTPADVAAAVAAARRAGFEDLSLDLLYDVPGQTLDSWRRSLERVVDLGPDHISAYALTLEVESIPSSDHLPLGRGAHGWRRRAALAQDEDRAADMDALTEQVLMHSGFTRYEIANWARPGHESRHNLAYWQRRPHEALGPGAHAFDGDRRRRWNAANLAQYVNALVPSAGGEATLPPGDEDVLDVAGAATERVILALRMRAGVPDVLLRDPQFAGPLNWAIDVGLVESHADRLRLTARGRLLSNELFVRLLPDPRRHRVTSTATSESTLLHSP